MSNPIEVVEAQNAVIRIQSEVIDELFVLLMQHINAEEADRLPVLQKINRAAMLREDIPGASVSEKGGNAWATSRE